MEWIIIGLVVYAVCIATMAVLSRYVSKLTSIMKEAGKGFEVLVLIISPALVLVLIVRTLYDLREEFGGLFSKYVWE